jgi:cytochrome P450
MSPWLTHRNALYWENPESFDPERFTSQRSGDRPQYAYYPFGGGLRMCIGNRFSIMEQTLAMTTRFEVQVLHDGDPDPIFTLAPKGGMCCPIGLGLRVPQICDLVS